MLCYQGWRNDRTFISHNFDGLHSYCHRKGLLVRLNFFPNTEPPGCVIPVVRRCEVKSLRWPWGVVVSDGWPRFCSWCRFLGRNVVIYYPTFRSVVGRWMTTVDHTLLFQSPVLFDCFSVPSKTFRPICNSSPGFRSKTVRVLS